MNRQTKEVNANKSTQSDHSADESLNADDDVCDNTTTSTNDGIDSKCDGNTDTSQQKSKTSFSVEDILSPTKFNRQITSFNPECFIHWQPWLMQEALRQNSMFTDLTLSFYKPFLASPKDGKCLLVDFINPIH